MSHKFESVRIRYILLNKNNGEIKCYIKVVSLHLLSYKNMEFTAESSLIKAQNLLVQYLSQKSYYNDNNNIYYKLYNAQMLLNDYVVDQHKQMFDNYKYIQEKKENNEKCLNNEEDVNKIDQYKDDITENNTQYNINFPPIIKENSFKAASLFKNKYFSTTDKNL